MSEPLITQQIVADKLLWGLWRSLDENYKSRYLADAWAHFENAIRSASYTDSLKAFLSKITTRLPIVLQAQFNKDVLSIVDSGQDEEILNWLRTETTYLVMLVRVANQERKEAYEEKLS
ncbi:MAG: hypothetical protein PHW12_01670 [Smithella sp.]|jgi:hypothetical protein|nr:hypothetical protein [Smithella sp.]